MSPILQLWFFHAQDINVPVVSFSMAQMSICTSYKSENMRIRRKFHSRLVMGPSEETWEMLKMIPEAFKYVISTQFSTYYVLVKIIMILLI